MAEPVPAGSEGSLCSLGRRDAGGCGTPEPAHTESAMDSSQNAEREDLEVTTCLSSWYSLLGTAVPDGTVIYSFLPVMLARSQQWVPAAARCVLSPTSLLFIPST